ncbi:hypothetical protein T4D_8284 [Trichinella pseudospiralis]|uniref:Uncharacterized protein n=1 Tax=Trichinella pseudospiralis TaxID=6337 RepID=A0A0V1E186_TRIPS|nr:hypothetical protein T4D_8284 [Trichinella pseudospiralis]
MSCFCFLVPTVDILSSGYINLSCTVVADLSCPAPLARSQVQQERPC